MRVIMFFFNRPSPKGMVVPAKRSSFVLRPSEVVDSLNLEVEMDSKKLLLVLLLISLLIPVPGWSGEENGDYLIGPGDVLDISVWKDETLSKSVVVLPDGKISFPLIGEIKAAGRTVPQLKEEITKKISPYAQDPPT